MTKRKDILSNNEDDPTTSNQGETLHKKHKKHKHKKHKRRKETDQEEEGSGYGSPGTPSTSSEGLKPALKLKIKIGGQPLEKRNVVKSEIIPEQDSDDSTKDDLSDESNPDEEDAWLDALESGRLEEVDEELKKMKDPNLMTARQRALLESKSKEKEEPTLPAVPQQEMSEEMIQRRILRAKKRKQQADEKREKDKKDTIERLLKKSDSKTKSKKLAKIVIQPKISYISNAETSVVCLPVGYDFPLAPKTEPVLPVAVTICGVGGCSNAKKYSCSRTGTPLCSLACYQKNLQVLAVMPSQKV